MSLQILAWGIFPVFTHVIILDVFESSLSEKIIHALKLTMGPTVLCAIGTISFLNVKVDMYISIRLRQKDPVCVVKGDYKKIKVENIRGELYP